MNQPMKSAALVSVDNCNGTQAEFVVVFEADGTSVCTSLMEQALAEAKKQLPATHVRHITGLRLINGGQI
jgi:hypothetical protein